MICIDRHCDQFIVIVPGKKCNDMVKIGIEWDEELDEVLEDIEDIGDKVEFLETIMEKEVYFLAFHYLSTKVLNYQCWRTCTALHLYNHI